MFCIHCGKELPDGARFCSFCGSCFVDGTDLLHCFLNGLDTSQA